MIDAREVYELLREIPHGRVTTYGAIAERLGDRKWARAVGRILHGNPDGDLYPCYKVVDAKGRLSSAYAFGRIGEQTRRLTEEGVAVEAGRVDLSRYGFRFV